VTAMSIDGAAELLRPPADGLAYLRHADAGYEEARRFAKNAGLRVPTGE